MTSRMNSQCSPLVATRPPLLCRLASADDSSCGNGSPIVQLPDTQRPSERRIATAESLEHLHSLISEAPVWGNQDRKET